MNEQQHFSRWGKKSHPSERNEEMKKICFTNLLLLGFDPVAEEVTNKIKFHRNMFDDVNKTGCEVVLHFLFRKLNSDLAKEEFKICYPVLDRKQEQMFRKACSSWVLNIAKENREFKFPSALASILMKKGGRKFYPMLFSLSRFVLFEVVRTDLGASANLLSPPKLTKWAEVGAAQKQFQALLDEHTNNFVSSQLYVVRHVKEERLQNLVAQYYYLKKQIKTVSSNLEAVLDDLDIPMAAQLKIVQGEDCDEWNRILDNNKKKEQQINDDWNCIEYMLDVREKLWPVCEEVVIRQKQGTTVHDYDLRDAFTRADLKKNHDLGEPLCLSRACGLWLDNVTRILEQFENEEIPNVKIFSDDLVKLHVNQIENMEKFKVSLRDDVLPNIQRDCFDLWKNSSYDKYKEQVKVWQSESSNKLCIPSPPMSLNLSFEETTATATATATATTVASSHRGSRGRRRISKQPCEGASRQSFLPKTSRKSMSEDSSRTSAMPIGSFESDDAGRMARSADVLRHFDPDSEFNLSLLESPLRQPTNEIVGRFEPPTNRKKQAPPRLLQLLSKMNLDNPPAPSIGGSGGGGDESSPREDEDSFTREEIREDFDLSAREDGDSFAREGEGEGEGEEEENSSVRDDGENLSTPEEDAEKLSIPEEDEDSIAREEKESSTTSESSERESGRPESPTLGSTPRSLPAMLSSNLRDFLSWEHVLQSQQQQQDVMLLRETKSAVDLPSFNQDVDVDVDKPPPPAEPECNVTLSRTNMSLADIFGEDDDCLLPPSPPS